MRQTSPRGETLTKIVPLRLIASPSGFCPCVSSNETTTCTGVDAEAPPAAAATSSEAATIGTVQRCARERGANMVPSLLSGGERSEPFDHTKRVENGQGVDRPRAQRRRLYVTAPPIRRCSTVRHGPSSRCRWRPLIDRQPPFSPTTDVGGHFGPEQSVRNGSGSGARGVWEKSNDSDRLFACRSRAVSLPRLQLSSMNRSTDENSPSVWST